ncbi:hypothetical protein EV204_105225 [Tissierella praeacuta]|uniref:hypothetical protein n=1 Tax=Tissierella praeacuta TaxID=43131 RepID=UPI00104DD057|nr:hypothetical protein [Tissierella praeacuta]TCU72889.1 hypothetical protein EV204_105225 [Tissierella praeacuta]
MEKQLLNRKLYKEIKKMDRQEMEEKFQETYSIGFQQGFREGAKVAEQIDFKIELVQLLEGIKGVGEKTKEKILQAYKERKID